MKKNLNIQDNVVRLILGFGAVLVFFIQFFNDALLELVLGIIGIYLIITVLIGFCPIYYFLGISRRKQKRDKFY